MNFERKYGYIIKFLIGHKGILGLLSFFIIVTTIVTALRIGQSIGKFIYQAIRF